VHLVHVDVERGDGVVAPGVVDEDVEAAAFGQADNFGFEGGDARCGCDVEGEGRDAF